MFQMRITMLRAIFLTLLLLNCLITKAETNITSTEVYQQIILIERETELIRQHFQENKKNIQTTETTADIKPRHVWQKCYMLQIKLVAFRRKHHLIGFAPVGIEPIGQFDSVHNWAQTQRILTEIRIIRKILGIKKEIDNKLPNITDKNNLDIYNKLNQIEALWDELSSSHLDASYTFDQILRINEDIAMILRQLNVFDSAIPPKKHPENTAADSLAQAFLLLEQVQRLQQLAGIETIDLSDFKQKNNITSAQVFNIVCLILAEIQTIKAKIGLNHYITPPATYHENKTSADVQQFLGYITNKLALIQHL